MKLSIHITLFATVLLLLSSCKKALEENPKSLAVETFYNTAAEVEAAVNAIYVPIRANNCMGGLYAAQLESYTDYVYGNGSYAVLNDFQGLNATNINRVSLVWDLLYLGVRNANLVIKNAPEGKAISQADIDRYVGEARFLRGLIYFVLVRNWGGVPLRTENTMTQRDLARANPEAVYDLIISDLQAAEAALPDQPAKAGRPSRWAAKTVLADVYLQLNQFGPARDKANEVIQANKYSLTAVANADDYQKIFGADVVSSTEEIFYLKYTRQAGQGYNWVMFVNDLGTKLHGAGGFTAHYSETTNFVQANWDNNDLRKSLWFSWNINRGPNSLLSKRLIDPQAVSADGAGNDYTLYRYSDLLLIYAEAASRAGSGPTAAALEALNKVHRRAYGYDPALPAPVDFVLADYNAESFFDLVVRERGYEFQYEAKRWLELKRTGKAAAIIQQAKGKTIAAKHYLWPIPVSEMNYNKALNPATDQNPGY